MEPARGRRDATDPDLSEGGNSQMSDPTPMDPAEPMAAAAPASEPAPAAAPAAAPAPAAPPAPTPASAAAAAVAARPTGITILAILAGLEGISGLLGGFGFLFLGAIGAGFGGTLLGLALLALAGLAFAFGWGAWTLQPWAWPLGVAFAGFAIVTNVLGLIGGGGLIGSVFGVAIAGAVLYYLNQPGIKSLFGRA